MAEAIVNRIQGLKSRCMVHLQDRRLEAVEPVQNQLMERSYAGG